MSLSLKFISFAYQIKPKFKKFGKGVMILKPQYLKTFGKNITIGNFATLICSSDKNIDLATWQTDKQDGW